MMTPGHAAAAAPPAERGQEHRQRHGLVPQTGQGGPGRMEPQPRDRQAAAGVAGSVPRPGRGLVTSPRAGARPRHGRRRSLRLPARPTGPGPPRPAAVPAQRGRPLPAVEPLQGALGHARHQLRRLRGR